MLARQGGPPVGVRSSYGGAEALGPAVAGLEVPDRPGPAEAAHLRGRCRRRRGRRGRSRLDEVERRRQPAVASSALGPGRAHQRMVADVRRRGVQPGEVRVGQDVVPGSGKHGQRLGPAPPGRPRPRRRGRRRRHRRTDGVGEDLRGRAERQAGRQWPGVDGHRGQQVRPEHPRQREPAPVLDRRQDAAPRQPGDRLVAPGPPEEPVAVPADQRLERRRLPEERQVRSVEVGEEGAGEVVPRIARTVPEPGERAVPRVRATARDTVVEQMEGRGPALGVPGQRPRVLRRDRDPVLGAEQRSHLDRTEPQVRRSYDVARHFRAGEVERRQHPAADHQVHVGAGREQQLLQEGADPVSGHMMEVVEHDRHRPAVTVECGGDVGGIGQPGQPCPQWPQRGADTGQDVGDRVGRAGIRPPPQDVDGRLPRPVRQRRGLARAGWCDHGADAYVEQPVERRDQPRPDQATGRRHPYVGWGQPLRRRDGRQGDPVRVGEGRPHARGIVQSRFGHVPLGHAPLPPRSLPRKCGYSERRLTGADTDVF